MPSPDGTVSLRWWRDDEALKKAEAKDGLYALVTNMAPRARQRRPPAGALQGPGSFRACPPFPKRPDSCATGVLEVEPSGRRPGPGMLGRPARLRPGGGRGPQGHRTGVACRRACCPGQGCPATAENIFKAFSGTGYQRVRTDKGIQYVVDPLSPAQAKILEALGISSVLPPSL